MRLPIGVAAAVLWSWSTVDALAQTTLLVSGTCPGPIDAVIGAATPNSTVVVFDGEFAVAGSVVGGARKCSSTILDLTSPKVRAQVTTDAAGAIQVSFVQPNKNCGTSLQVLDVASCAVSSAEEIPTLCGPDADLDGFSFCHGDCDDTNATVHPGAVDSCGDGVDANCSGTDASCAPIGSYLVNDGPSWTDDPPVWSCIEACALNFGGISGDYHCSVDPLVLTFTGFMSGWADSTFCKSPLDEDAKQEPLLDPGYNCGTAACAYSAFVEDNCTNGATNHCWTR